MNTFHDDFFYFTFKNKNIRIKKGYKYKFRHKKSKIDSVVNTRDFSAIEDNERWRHLIGRLVAKAGQNAAAEARVAGLPTVFVENNKIIREDATGKQTVLSTGLLGRKEFYVHYSPKLKLHVRSK